MRCAGGECRRTKGFVIVHQVVDRTGRLKVTSSARVPNAARLLLQQRIQPFLFLAPIGISRLQPLQPL